MVTFLAVMALFLVQNPERGGSDQRQDSIQVTTSQELRDAEHPAVQLIKETYILLKTLVLLDQLMHAHARWDRVEPGN